MAENRKPLLDVLASHGFTLRDDIVPRNVTAALSSERLFRSNATHDDGWSESVVDYIHAGTPDR